MATSIGDKRDAMPWQSLDGFMGKEELAAILEQHRAWVESHGESGERADLSGAKLAGSSLAGANLRGALLQKADLMGADLSLADLQGACLIQADLQAANLLGAEVGDADLRGALLTNAEGLWTGRLGGTNLLGAVLPESLSLAHGPKIVAQATKAAYRLFVAMLLANLVTWCIIATTTDARLLNNSSALPFLRNGKAVPIVGFYLVMPLLLLCFYITFHFFLLRLWGGLAALPAVFPDGSTVERSGPWALMGLVRRHIRWLNQTRSPMALVEAVGASLLAYWTVPATLVLLWARYLPRQDLRDTMMHVFLVVAAVAAATILPQLAARILRARGSNLRVRRRSKFSRSRFVALGVGSVLTLISMGIIWGVPQDASRATEVKSGSIRRWAAEALWTIGYNPYAALIDATISSRPAQWSGRDEDLSQVHGARLDQANLRYVQAYRAFLTNAHLWKADLRGSDLSEADLRGANLRQATLPGASLDRAKLYRASAARADLRGADLRGADLHQSDLAFASLQDAIFIDANIGGASLYSANLERAQLLRAKLEKADMRDAILQNADLTFANLNSADLWSAKLANAQLKEAQLESAILIDADLRNADLRGADLQGAVLRGANLAGADLRGAHGLAAAQVCSTMSRRGTQLDQDLQNEVMTQCGPAR